MSKRIYITAITVLFLGLVGCHKLDIKPNTGCEEPRTEDNYEKGLRNPGEGDFGRDEDGDLITDPNHDEDEDQQTKR